ncbi:MBL fold metallo-hydrolase [Halobacillus yeomjeoni]|uniref:MBL fold metallo-hydrolase n=1 Tax=Halobacillus yeomjeoni TaxID=311194 RepID=A0A931MUB3_9BACI|nr:MBL fold metallo-hydrolase [Halobacillus yeomjeoni]MBH0229783.1 MBL fold metallo-hydrolase [Halobacillus yeomjeoni]
MQTMKDTIKKITLPTPYAVGDVHVYLLEGDRLTLIDAGVKTDDAWQALVKQLAECGYTPEDIEQVVLTHHHPDHMGLVEKLPNVSSVAGHPKLRPWLERDETFFKRYEQFFYEMYQESGVPQQYYPLLKRLKKPLEFSSKGSLTEELTDGGVIPGHDEWVTVETPGHAQSHISFYREADGAFIGGDHLLEPISSNPLLEPPYEEGEERPRPLLQYRASMEKLLNFDIQIVYPGHGKVFDQAHALIRRRLKKQVERAEKVLKMFEDGPLGAYEVCKQLFPKHIESQFGLTMSETIGQLDYLEHTGQLKTSYSGLQKLYYVNR